MSNSRTTRELHIPPKSQSALVLDLDECLVSAQFGKEAKFSSLKKNPKTRDRVFTIGMMDQDGSGKISYTWLITRPHLNEFLREASRNIDHVFVWTAGIYKYAHAVVNAIWPRGTQPPTAIFSREDIEKSGNNGKPHSYILKKYPQIDPRRIVGLDDRLDNFVNNPALGILIPEYKAEPTEASILQEDDALLVVLDLFESDDFHDYYFDDLNLNLFKDVETE